MATNPEDSLYIYCVTKTRKGGVDIVDHGGQVELVTFRDLACAVSSGVEIAEYERENLLCHERVIERVMEDGAVLPVKFGTAGTTKEALIDEVLKPRYEELSSLLEGMKDKKEFTLRGFWADMSAIFQEITREVPQIRTLKHALEKQKKVSYQAQIQLGEMVQTALERKKEKEKTQIAFSLKEIAYDFKELPLQSDPEVFHGAFLVSAAQEKELDRAISKMTSTDNGRRRWQYVGPAPPFNFVQLSIYLS